MNKEQVREYIVKRAEELTGVRTRWLTIRQELLSVGVDMSSDSIRTTYARFTKTTNKEQPVEKAVEQDISQMLLKGEQGSLSLKYKHLLESYQQLQSELEAAHIIKGNVSSYTIKPSGKSQRSESTAVAIWSDWHLEERVEPDTVNGLNEFNLEVATQRTEKLFRKTVDFIKMYQQDTDINEMIIALLGDFISNDIHDELMETALLQPVEAVLFAQRQIISGIDYILKHTKVNLTIPCHSGNHARTTQKRRVATEAGHSLEFLMYHNLRDYYRNEPRVRFIIPRSYLSYLTVYNTVLRLHHGHDIRYGGGIGGLFIPAYKAISQWNKGKVASLDLFGHFHQTKDGDTFYCNGSLIGFNPYAISIKADFEPPRQNFFLIHRELGRTINSPIYLQ